METRFEGYTYSQCNLICPERCYVQCVYNG